MHKLVIQDDEGKTTVVPLIRDEITVGRKEGNTIRLTERNVSRRHARIVRKNGTFVIEDLSSYNGVRVNGTRVQGRVGLSVSDRIQIGDYLIELKADTATQASDPYTDQKTQPIDRANPLESSSGAIPVAQDSMADIETRKMASIIPPMGPPAVPGAIPIPGVVVNSGAPPGASLDPSATAAALSSPSLPAMTGVPPDQLAETAPARLAVLSTNYAGREFLLDKPAMIIGRTGDNDIVINHRSISRHHAKVVRENGRYAIVDLQSSNGVRVNGEDYGKVELRRADIIDLGHVRLRFVEPGEDFIFARDAQVVPTGGRRGLFFGLVTLVVLVGAVAAFVLTRGQSSTHANTGAPQQPDSAQVATQAADAAAHAGTATPPSPPSSETIKPLLDQALEAIKQEQWDEAIAAASKALQVEQDDEVAKERLAKAQAEKGNKARYDKFNEAVRSKSPARVSAAFAAIDEDSVYRARAHVEYDRIGADYLAQVTANARRLLRSKKCRDIRDLAEQAGKTWPGSEEEVDKVAGECDAAVATANRKQSENSQGSSSTTTPPPKPDGDEDDKPSGKNIELLVEEAKDAYKKEQYGVALKRCKEAYAISKNDPNLMSLCGLAACNLKNTKEAKRFYTATSNPDRKTFIVQKCLGNGIDVRQ